MSFQSAAARRGQVSPSALIPLEYPQSVAIYNSYADAQSAVDYLADENFPVENLVIVGTDLKSVERVLGRRTWGTVIGGGALSGVGTGLFIGVIMLLLFQGQSIVSIMLTALLIGVAMGVLAAAMAHAATRGHRDFNSVQATVATRYEVLGEHKVIEQARSLLARRDSRGGTQWGPAQYIDQQHRPQQGSGDPPLGG